MRWLPVIMTGLFACGCRTNPYAVEGPRRWALRDRALEALKRGVQYDPLASVRAAAVEGWQDCAPRRGLPWIRNALADEAGSVRFAAALALGVLRDKGSEETLRTLLGDSDESVRLSAVFALHRLGCMEYTGLLADDLLYHRSWPVRANAALLLGRLGERGALSLLARAMTREQEEVVRVQLLEAMALLGNVEAVQQLAFAANSGSGELQAVALLALGTSGAQVALDTLRYKLVHADHLEVKLAAARGLGMLNRADGLPLALEAMRFNAPVSGRENDPPENQVARVRQMAARALGAIGDPAGLPALADVLHHDAHPLLQVAAAAAILEILQRDSPWARAGRRRDAPSSPDT